jgi:hypothetical protein
MLENIQGLLTPAILSRVTGQTGESESAVMKGFGAAIPAIAAMIANRSDERVHETGRGSRHPNGGRSGRHHTRHGHHH